MSEPSTEPRAPGPDVDGFVRAILDGERARVVALARPVLARGAAQLYEGLVAPAMRRVGELWRDGRITVAQEHLATEVVRTAIASLYSDFPWPIATGPTALVACVQGERHALGAQMVADLLALDGWNALFLGADLPPDALADAVAQRRAELVCLSASLEAHRDEIAPAIALVRARSPSTRILLGGRAFTIERAGAETFGSDAVAGSAADAVAIARRWKT